MAGAFCTNVADLIHNRITSKIRNPFYANLQIKKLKKFYSKKSENFLGNIVNKHLH